MEDYIQFSKEIHKLSNTCLFNHFFDLFRLDYFFTKTMSHTTNSTSSLTLLRHSLIVSIYLILQILYSLSLLTCNNNNDDEGFK